MKLVASRTAAGEPCSPARCYRWRLPLQSDPGNRWETRGTAAQRSARGWWRPTAAASGPRAAGQARALRSRSPCPRPGRRARTPRPTGPPAGRMRRRRSRCRCPSWWWTTTRRRCATSATRSGSGYSGRRGPGWSCLWNEPYGSDSELVRTFVKKLVNERGVGYRMARPGDP